MRAIVLLVSVAGIFAWLFWLSDRIEPDKHLSDNDDWMKGGPGSD